VNILAIVTYSKAKLHLLDCGWARQELSASADLWQRDADMLVFVFEQDGSYHAFETIGSFAGGRTIEMRKQVDALYMRIQRGKRNRRPPQDPS
jgi:hypothetical protein